MKRTTLVSALLLALFIVSCGEKQTACGPVPTADQKALQDMEMYAFIHYSLNTYTDQEWGNGDESPALFNPSDLDVRQWVATCKAAGMKGIIFTAKHHCGFCMWPSEYTDFSVKSSPWKEGKGDVVRELSDACREAGLRFGIYLSPWDRNHPQYAAPEYVEYFRNQLRELLSNYGEIFEVWFDGANGGDGWYGGANEVRKIDPLTYYGWAQTYDMIRELQPHCVIWNDGGELRGDLRWVGTEAGRVGQRNWSLLYSTGKTEWEHLHYGVEDGDLWVPGETNTSIRPGWFYHTYEDAHVKSLSKLMDTYYKSVGRNSTLLLNFPVMPNGLISSIDSIRGATFANMVNKIFSNDLAAGKKTVCRGDSVFTIDFGAPVEFNRFMACEDITLGQRVKSFRLEAFSDESGEWLPLSDMLAEDGDGLETIGRKRIICFPSVTASQLRMTVTATKATPVISYMGVFLAPDITADMAEAGEKKSSHLNIEIPDEDTQSIIVRLDNPATIKGLRYLPPQEPGAEGIVVRYSLSVLQGDKWEKVAEGELSNIVNNPIWQTINIPETTTRAIRLDAVRLNKGSRVIFDDLELIACQKE